MFSLRRKKASADRGFTLVELLVGAIVSAIFLLATAGIIVQVIRTDRRETEASESQSELAQLLDFIQQDLTNAVYIYNDVANLTAGGEVEFVEDGNGIPDLNELLYDRDHIPKLANTAPILAFWKTQPLPFDEEAPNDPTQSPCYSATEDFNLNDDARPYFLTREVFVLIVYYIRDNDFNPVWRGPARVLRAELEPLDPDTCDRNENFYPTGNDPVPPQYFDWPVPSVGGVPPAPTALPPASGLAIPLATSLHFNPGTSATLDDAVDCPPDYSFGGTPFIGTTPTTGFYTCVSIAGGTEPQNVLIFLKGNWSQLADPFLWRRFEAGETITDEEFEPYIQSLQAQFFSRSSFQRTNEE